jgi:hypothetical protein
MRNAHLLAAVVEVALADNDLTLARTTAADLSSIAEAFGRPAVNAMAALARGAVRLADNDAAGALAELHAAATIWSDMELPYEQAQARLLIGAAAKALGDEEGARLELQTARDAFQRLGAHADARRATEAMTGRAGQRSGLTERGRGAASDCGRKEQSTDRRGARHISEHTVARHVQNIFAKLGVSSRVAATALAVTRQLV